MRRGASRVPLFLTALGVLVLVGVVAVASSGSTPTGSNDSRPPADFVIDTMFSLGLLLLIPGAAILIYGLMQRKAIAREMAFQRYPRTGIRHLPRIHARRRRLRSLGSTPLPAGGGRR